MPFHIGLITVMNPEVQPYSSVFQTRTLDEGSGSYTE